MSHAYQAVKRRGRKDLRPDEAPGRTTRRPDNLRASSAMQYAELVALGVGQNGEPLVTVLPDVRVG
jgi:hypothetical protein